VKFLLERRISVLTKRPTFEICGSQRSSKARRETLAPTGPTAGKIFLTTGSGILPTTIL